MGVPKNLQFHQKETPAQMFLCEIRKIFGNISFHRTSPVAAFVFSETKT